MEKFQKGTEGGLIRSGHIWRMCGESVVMDVGDAGTSGAMRHGEMCTRQWADRPLKGSGFGSGGLVP